MVLFCCAGLVVAGSLAVTSLAAFGLDGETVLVIVSAAMAPIVAAAAVPLARTAYKNTRETPELAPPYVLVIASITVITFESLLVLNVFIGNPGLLLVALSIALLYGLWVFVRLMTRPN